MRALYDCIKKEDLSEEEIIKEVKNHIRELNGYTYKINTEYNKGKALQGLLDLYNKQKEEIKALELIHKTYKEEMKSIENRFISKDKIRDKIKEYKEHLNIINDKAPKRKNGKVNRIYNSYNRQWYENRIDLLEELLEEEQ